MAPGTIGFKGPHHPLVGGRALGQAGEVLDPGHLQYDLVRIFESC